MVPSWKQLFPMQETQRERRDASGEGAARRLAVPWAMTFGPFRAGKIGPSLTLGVQNEVLEEGSV